MRLWRQWCGIFALPLMNRFNKTEAYMQAVIPEGCPFSHFNLTISTMFANFIFYKHLFNLNYPNNINKNIFFSTLVNLKTTRVKLRGGVKHVLFSKVNETQRAIWGFLCFG